MTHSFLIEKNLKVKYLTDWQIKNPIKLLLVEMGFINESNKKTQTLTIYIV